MRKKKRLEIFRQLKYSIKNLLIRFIHSDDFRWCKITVLMVSVWLGIAPYFYNHVLTEATECMKSVYFLFDNNLPLNIPICLFFVYACYKVSCKILSPNCFRYHWLLAFAFVYLLLYYQSPFIYAEIAWGIDYRLFLSVLLPGVFMVVRILLFVFSERKENTRIVPLNNVSGFSADNDKRYQPSLPVVAYAEKIIAKLRNTNLKSFNESFAIGITSEWGTGKTSFLRLLKEKIRDSISEDIVDFNPWMCQSPEQVTKDFFSTLRNKLSKRHPELSSPIKQYAKQLRAITLPMIGNASIELEFFSSEKSLLEMKEQLSRKFSMLRHPVVVIIDDLDRLDSSEVFEVLRLIRNTADLGNVIYLVAYDKSYITKILENQHISDPTAYLEKIFQLEIQLPSVDDEQVWNNLLSELRSQLPNGVDISFIESQKDLIKEILNTYRRAKRFARLFSLDYDYLSGEAVHDLNLKEKFLLDLLQMDDKEIYDILWNKPEKLLSNYRTIQGVRIWEYRIPKNQQQEREDDDIIILKDGTHIKPTTNKLLSCLWPDTPLTPDPFSIRYVEHSPEYFTLKVQFSGKDVEQMVDSNDVDALMKKWSDKVGKRFNEVIIEYNNNHKLTVQQKTNLIWGVLSASFYGSFIYAGGIKELVKCETDERVIIDWFKKKPDDKECNINRLSLILFTITAIISSSTKENILGIIAQRFVDNKKYTILDCIKSYDSIFLNDFYWLLSPFDVEDRAIAFEYLIDIYSKMEPKPKMEEYNKERDALLKENNNNVLKQLFGDKWPDYLVTLLQRCIEPIKITE